MNAVVHAKPRLLLLLIGVYLECCVSFCFAGTCWSTMVKGNRGRCTELLYSNVSKEECCNGVMSSRTTAWSPEDLELGMLFVRRVFDGGAVCTSCKDSCRGVECDNDRTCVMRKGIPKCVCASNCKNGARKRPNGRVCGTDGRTYGNWCRLKKKSCKQRHLKLSLSYYGACESSCDRVRCQDEKTCLLDQNLTPHCVHCAKKKCPATTGGKYRQVCGSDGVTYKSACHLRNAACHAGKAIPIAYKGICKENATCHDVRCPDRQRCLIDVQSGGRPRCVHCPTSCRPQYHHGPICGTNDSTYDTWCQMMKDACVKGYVINTKYAGNCTSSRHSTGDVHHVVKGGTR